MSSRATTIASSANRHAVRPRARLALSGTPSVRDPRRHLSRNGFGDHRRRDPRRFGRAIVRAPSVAAVPASAGSEELRLFAHTFGAAFLFVTLFIA